MRQAFVKTPILDNFDPERHIQIEIDDFGFAISGILRQLTLDDSSQWHPIAFFSRKMISAKTWYKTYNGKLLAIIEAFKTWRHYLEGCKHEVLVLTNHNNLQCFMNIKSLSSRQVQWAQKLSKYYFRIDYERGKANGAVDALCQYPQRSAKEKETLQAENIKILHRLQSLLAWVLELSVLSLSVFSPLHQVLIYGTVILS